MEWLTKVGEFAKLPPKFIAVVALSTGAVLFLPERVAQVIYVTELKQEFGVYIAIAFVLSSAYLVMEGTIWITIHVRGRIQQQQQSVATDVQLKMLDSAERSVIREFFFDGQSTLKLPVDHPTVARLVHDGILFQIGTLSEQSSVGSLCSLILSKVAKDRLTPDELGLGQYIISKDGDNWRISDEGIEWIRSNRPSFMKKIERDRAIFEGYF